MSLPHSPLVAEDAEGFILAGGRSTRMGSDKALMPFACAPLIQHAIATLRSIGLHPRIAGARSDLSEFAPFVPDNPAEADSGPLTGIYSALEAAQARYVVFLPIDLPLIPPSLINYLLQHALLTRTAITISAVAGFAQTFPVVIDRRAIDKLRDCIARHQFKCLAAFQSAADALDSTVATLPIEWLAQAGNIHHPAAVLHPFWFLNVNTPQDLARAASLL